MSINYKRNLKNKYTANENKKDNIMRIATIVTILTTIYCIIILLLFKLKIQ